MSNEVAAAYLAKIEADIVPLVEAKGYEAYETKVFFSSKRYTIRILIDRREGGIMLDECADISRMIDTVIEEKNLIAENYVIEVASPGLDRELKTLKDFARIQGKRVQVWLTEPVLDKKAHAGNILSVDGEKGSIVIETKTGNVEVPLSVLHVGKQDFIF